MPWYSLKTFAHEDRRSTAATLIDTTAFPADSDEQARLEGFRRAQLSDRGAFASLFGPDGKLLQVFQK